MDTFEKLKKAMMKHFTERGRQVLAQEIDTAIQYYVLVTDEHPDNEEANERLAVLSVLKATLE